MTLQKLGDPPLAGGCMLRKSGGCFCLQKILVSWLHERANRHDPLRDARCAMRDARCAMRDALSVIAVWQLF
jgi:hypothetical protein